MSRRLSHELSPAVLRQSNFVDVLRWLAQQVEQQFGLRIQLDIDDENVEVPFFRSFMFRAVRELLFNVVKHAGVKEVHVGLASQDEKRVISIKDQGAGFDPDILNSMATAGGLGLVSLRERASCFGGELRIESAPGCGSRFTLMVPLRRNETE